MLLGFARLAHDLLSAPVGAHPYWHSISVSWTCAWIWVEELRCTGRLDVFSGPFCDHRWFLTHGLSSLVSELVVDEVSCREGGLLPWYNRLLLRNGDVGVLLICCNENFWELKYFIRCSCKSHLYELQCYKNASRLFLGIIWKVLFTDIWGAGTQNLPIYLLYVGGLACYTFFWARIKYAHHQISPADTRGWTYFRNNGQIAPHAYF